MKLTAQGHLVPRFRMSGVILLLPRYAFTAQRDTFCKTKLNEASHFTLLLLFHISYRSQRKCRYCRPHLTRSRPPYSYYLLRWIMKCHVTTASSNDITLTQGFVIISHLLQKLKRMTHYPLTCYGKYAKQQMEDLLQNAAHKITTAVLCNLWWAIQKLKKGNIVNPHIKLKQNRNFPNTCSGISFTKFQQICEIVYETRGKVHYANHSLMWINITCDNRRYLLHRIRTLFHQQFNVYKGKYSSGLIQTRLNVATDNF